MFAQTALAEFTPEAPNPHQCLEAVGEKLAGVLHDLGGPLGVIQGFAELMAEEPDEDQRQQMLREVMRQVQRITALRDQTLAFARGERALLKHTVHLYQLVRTIAAAVDREFANTTIEFELSDSYLGPAELDDSLLLRAVENLARNAHEAMTAARGSRFRIDVASDGDCLLLSFTDDGPGMPEAMVGHVFERFHSAGKEHGHGLGLAIVQDVACRHGGSAQCFSLPEVGTRFELRLPVLPVAH